MGRPTKRERYDAAVTCWSSEEIVEHYNRAADKYRIIEILADLNACSKERIRAVLKKAGIDAPTKPVAKPERKRAWLYLLESGGKMYKIRDIVDRTSYSYSYVQRRALKSEWIEIGGVKYRVVRKKRRDA
jgi:hypothetical protein